MENLNIHNTQDVRFLEFLAARGLRRTPERFEILHCALGCGGHFEADALHRLLEKSGYHVSRATVYNTLELLCEAGILRKLLLDTRQAQYEIAGLNHIHLVCTHCGEIREVAVPEMSFNILPVHFHGFSPSFISTCVYGKCKKCIGSNEP